MRQKCFAFVLGAITGSSVLNAQVPAPVASEPLALVNADVVDVRGGRVTPSVTMVLRDGRIESVGPGSPPKGVKLLDLRGKCVLPGLIDAHTHVADFAGFRRALESGVTTVRSAGVSNYADVGFHQLVKRGAVIGPDVVTAGYHIRPQMALDAFLNHPEYADLMSGLNTIEKLRRAVQMNLSHGVDWIKILATDPAGIAARDPRRQLYSEEEIRAVVQEASAKGAPVEAHAHGDEGAMAAVKAGVRSIEHGTYLSEATLRLMKEKGTYLDPTYTWMADGAEIGGDPETEAARASAWGTVPDPAALRIRHWHMQPRLRETIVRAHQMGIVIVTGSDQAYAPSSLVRIAREMAHFVEMGFTPPEAIQSATIRNAEMLRLDKSIGTLDPGYEADLLVVEKNPLEDIVTVQDPLLVISNGRIAVDRLSFGRAPGSSHPQ